jgi:hypothetical protein
MWLLGGWTELTTVKGWTAHTLEQSMVVVVCTCMLQTLAFAQHIRPLVAVHLQPWISQAAIWLNATFVILIVLLTGMDMEHIVLAQLAVMNSE